MGKYIKQSGYRMNNHIFREILEIESSISCSILCSDEQQCVSFNYKEDSTNTVCQLSRSLNTSTGDFIADSDWDYYEMKYYF